MSTGEVWLAIVLVSVGALAARAAALFLPGERRLPPVVVECFDLLPAAAFAALVVPAVLAPTGGVDLVSARVVAAGLAVLVAWRTRSMALTLLVGLAVVLLWP